MRNEVAHIGRCLETLLADVYPRDRLEVIVADGESTDGSAETVRELSQVFPNIRLCSNPQRTTPYALNIGIRASVGDVIIILGSRTFVEPGFLQESVLALERSGAEAAGGVMEAVGENRFAEAVAAAVCSRFGVGNIAYRQSKTEDFADTAVYAAYRRTTFEQVGLFDEELIRDQDDELNYRIRAHGGRILVTPRVRTRYVSRSSPKALWKQYFWYGHYKVRVLQKHPRMMQPRHFAPPLAVAAGGAGVLASVVAPKVLFVSAPLAGIYGCGVVAAACATARRIGWGRFPSLLVTFPILHASYGSGFLLGLCRFAHRWWMAEPSPPTLGAVQHDPAAISNRGLETPTVH
jgi:GT2 family glycosyltransferase